MSDSAGLPPKKLVVVDFDGTLVFTPSPNDLIEGITLKEWYNDLRAKEGKKSMKGWWGWRETLLPPIFGSWENGKIKADPKFLNHSLAQKIKSYQEKEDVICILLTGRHQGIKKNKRHVCELILESYQIFLDRYYYLNTHEPTIVFKTNIIKSILKEFPSIESVEIWEDRIEHVKEFEAFISKIDSVVGNVHHVTKTSL